MVKRITIALLMSLVSVSYSQMATNDAGTQGLISNQTSQQLAKFTEQIDNQLESINKFNDQIDNQIKQIENLTNIEDYIGNARLTVPDVDKLKKSLDVSKPDVSLDDFVTQSSGRASVSYTGGGAFRELDDISSGGTQINRDEQAYKRYGAVENAAENYKTVSTELDERANELKQDISATITAISTAEDQVTVDKLNAKLAGLNGELQTIEAERQAALNSVLLQHTLNENQLQKEADDAKEKVFQEENEVMSNIIKIGNKNLRNQKSQIK